MAELLGIEGLKGVELLTPLGLIKSWYDSGTKGILMGYQHDVLDCHRFFGNLVGELPRLGVKTVYLEESVTWQPDFEELRRTGKYSREWEKKLEMIRLMSGGMEDGRFLLEALRARKDMKLVFIDSPEDRETGRRIESALEGKTRDEYMMSQIKRYPPEGKFISISGYGHAACGTYLNYDIKLDKDVLVSPLGALMGDGDYKDLVKSVVCLGSGDYKSYEIYKYFNDLLPKGTPPIAFDFSHGGAILQVFDNSKLKGWLKRELFSGLIFFPHAISS